MNISYTCRQCEQPVTQEVLDEQHELNCPTCGAVTTFSSDEYTPGKVHRCLLCGCSELFVRKDFSQRLGVAIVVVGFVASSIAWGFHYRYTTYAILFATALIDVILYLTVSNVLQCYRCRAEYRRLAGLEDFEPFNLETHERFRQQAIRLAQGQKS